MYSLTRRLLFSVSLALAVFFSLTAFALDTIFRDLAERSLRQLLDAQMVALVAAAEPDDSGRLRGASTAAEARLQTPGSGLYAQISGIDGETIWRSPSAAGTFIDFGAAVPAGEASFGIIALADGSNVAIVRRGLQWEVGAAEAQQLSFAVASSMAPYQSQLQQFRTRLFGGLLVVATLVIITLAFLLRWVMAPVRRLQSEIAAVEAGQISELGGGYPREMAGVTAGLNTLLASERRRIARYRESLGNLAHTLKTPLAVIRSVLEPRSATASDSVIAGEVTRMTDIIESQLQRAAQSSGPLLGQAAVPIAPVVADLRLAMLRVHAGKDFVIEVRLPGALQFAGDRNDLMEMIGNVLDNACKWCCSRVRVSVLAEAAEADRGWLRLRVEDDGPGFPAALRSNGPERGLRADERTPGHGIGLAMARETCELYGGELRLDESELGGGRVELRLPSARA